MVSLYPRPSVTPLPGTLLSWMAGLNCTESKTATVRLSFAVVRTTSWPSAASAGRRMSSDRAAAIRVPAMGARLSLTSTASWSVCERCPCAKLAVPARRRNLVGAGQETGTPLQAPPAGAKKRYPRPRASGTQQADAYRAIGLSVYVGKRRGSPYALPGRRDRDRAWRKAVGEARRTVRDVGSTDDRGLRPMGRPLRALAGPCACTWKNGLARTALHERLKTVRPSRKRRGRGYTDEATGRWTQSFVLRFVSRLLARELKDTRK